MPGRTAASTAGPSTQVKQEGVRIKKEKAKQEKVNGRRHTETPVEEELEQEQVDEEGADDGTEQQNNVEHDEEQEAASPRGNKRRRMNGEGDSTPSGGDGQPEPILPRVKTLPRGADGYV